MEFRDALKSFRSEFGLVQADIATALHINIATVTRWEQGKTVPNRSFAIALLEYAKSKSATSSITEALETTLAHATKQKLLRSKDSLFTVEHATISQLIEDAAFPIYVCDLCTDEIIYVNRAMERQLGKRLDELAGKKCHECVMHMDTPCDFCHKAELADDSFTSYDAYRPFDGASYHMQGKLVQWNGRRAQIRYLLGQNLTPASRLFESENAAEAVAPEPEPSNNMSAGRNIKPNADYETSAELFKAIFENINGGVSVVIYEDKGSVRLAYANDRYYDLFGYTKAQFERELKDPHDGIHPADRERAAEAIAKVRETKQASIFRYRIIKRDKSIAYVSCNSSITVLESINGFVLISVLTDITESVQLEQQLTVSGQRLDAIMKNMNSAVTASIIQNDGTVEFLFCNDLYYEMFGYTKEQFRSEVPDLFMLAHPEDRNHVRDVALRLHRVGDTQELLYRAITRDGKTKWLRAHITMMTFPDAEELVQLAVYTDVTDIAEAKEKLAAQHDQIARLLNNTPSGIAIAEVNSKDVVGTLRTVYYNDRFIEFSGYSRSEYDALLKNNEMSFVFEEDIHILQSDIKNLCAGEIGVCGDSTVRCHTKDGGFRWLLLTGQLAEKRGDICIINIALMDITDKQNAIDRQRINDEMLRIAAETDQRSIIIYDVKNNSCRVESRLLNFAKYGETFEDVPRSLIDRGIVAPDSEDELCALFARIRDGEKQIRISLQIRSGPDKYEWFECNAAAVFDAEGLPDHAVLVFHDITEQRIKEAVFKKWQQSIAARPPESYTLFRCNLSRETSIDAQDGSLLKISFSPEARSFNSKSKLYADEYVYPDDREAYVKLVDADLLLSMFYRGEHFASLEYREITESGEAVWRRLTIETVEYTDSADVQAFLMYEDIDEEKKNELAARELAQTDPLTGALNRVAFTENVNSFIKENPNAHCALIMLDMDGFKQLNDTFGHAAGDQALQEVASVLRSYARNGDLVCRLGGDEFMVCLRDVPYEAVIGKTAQLMCEHIRKAYSQEVLLSASAGIAVYPRDGRSYDELYRSADKALYKVKQAGKGFFAFFSATTEEQTEDVTRALSALGSSPQSPRGTKRRMLIVDDNETNRTVLKNFFKDEFLIETAKNGTEAMVRLRHFGVSLSVVLLDLIMPGVDGFAVLQRMQSDANLRTIPVVIVTGDEERSTLLRAFEQGAAEYVTKPVDADIIRMRVKSVISKAENERLRAQNSYLLLQKDEEVKYRTVLESTGTVVVEYDWRNHVFIYDGEISKYIAGTFDHRGLWQIFLSDMVADSADVKTLQNALMSLAGDREQSQDSKLIKLKTPQGVKHWFRVNIYKHMNDFGLAEKLIITFNDVHDEVLANDRLLFQATRDELTGLYNRSGFLEKAAELIVAQKPGFYVMTCIDVEKFQVINDQYGIEKGDEVLRHIAATIGGFVERNNGICCRYMADKFVVLFPAKLLSTGELEQNHTIASNPGCIPRPLRLRIGRCVINDTTLSVSAILDRAVMAETLAKGRYDTYIINYDESMRDSILQEQQLVGNMVNALQNGEFEPWFQPQYNHATGALIGVEALVRWRRDGKIIPPSDFVPVFEKNGFIYEVDQYMWRQVCILLRRWLDEAKHPLPVSVNISRHDMFQENFVQVITGLLAEYRLPADLLRLEITESAFSADTSVITDIAGKLIAAGFTVEIDDFGSGYSSLNTLKDVPASILKLDMRFFETTANSSRGGNIVESVVRMAKWLGMAVIAEGVEDKAQADYLKSIGCHYIQGYYYSKPLPLEEYEKLMQESNAEHKLSRLETLESLDSDLFWNPKSLETLIFNSYVGGACIFEFHGGKSEMLRYNDQYISELHGLISENSQIQDVTIVPFLDDKSRTELLGVLHEALESGKEVSCEMRLTNGSQTEYVRATCRVIAKTTGRTLYYCVIQNLTEQRTLEQERTEIAEQLSTIMSNIDCGVSASVFHDESHIDNVFANDGFYKLFGYTQEQFKAEVANLIDPILPEDRDKTTATVARIVRERGSATYEYRCVKRDGSVIWVQTTNTVVSLAGLGETVLLAVTTDVTALHRAEEQSIETADRLSTVMNAMRNGMTAVTVKENIQFLFANDRYCEIHGIGQKGNTHSAIRDAFSMVHPDDRERVHDIVKGLSEVGQSTKTEYRIKLSDKSLRYVRAEITVTKLIGVDAPVQVAIYSDITDEKNASEHLRFLNESAGEILAQPDSEKAINDTLRKLLDYFAGERTYIFELHDDAQTSDNTYEVCATGIVPEIERLQSVPYDMQRYWFDAFDKAGFVAISDVAAITEVSKTAMRELLLAQNIHSIIVAPLWRDDKLIGYIGVDNPTKAVEQVSQLIALSDYIAVLITRRDLMNAVERGRHTMQQLIDDTPGGFLRMRIRPDNTPVIISFNAGICRMLGMTAEEVMAEYGDNAYNCVVTEDIAAVKSAGEESLSGNGRYTCKCRLKKKDGTVIWVQVFGRFIKDENGELYRNSFFTDITEQRNMDQLRIDLLDNLPFGAAMFAYDGNTITTLHVNKKYTETVHHGMTNSLDGFDPVKAIHPDDRQSVLDDLRAATSDKRNAVYDIRLLYSGNEYRFFHLDASIVPSGDGQYVLYVAYAHITDRDKELKETSERLKLLSDSIPGGIATFRCMPESIEPVYYNDGICTLTGYSREEFASSIAILDLVFDDDKPVIKEQLELMRDGKTVLDFSVRIHTKNGGYKWVDTVASVVVRERKNTFLVSAVLTDVTERQEESERLRVSEELNRLAIDQSGQIIARYDVAKRTLTLPHTLPDIFNVPKMLENMPEEQVRLGRISPDTADAYCSVFERINSGEASGEAIYQQNSTLGWRWLKSQFTTVFASDGRPVSAVISFEDITEQREKEAIYTRWQNAMAERSKDSYTLVRCNLNKNYMVDSWDGSLLDSHLSAAVLPFNSRMTEYADNHVYVDDRKVFRTFLSSDTMLAEYYRGHRSDSIDYREQREDNVVRWLRLTADLVEYPDSTDVEAYLLFENIDEQKHNELSTIRRAETDPLTGVLNRASFITHMEQAIREASPGVQHALFMLDIDNFKEVNDNFGHAVGDHTLIELTSHIRALLRRDDLIGRLGGDEFLVFIKDVPNTNIVEAKAKQICELRITVDDVSVSVTSTIGIAMIPKDGTDFNELYKKVDAALYWQKEHGKNGYHFVE